MLVRLDLNWYQICNMQCSSSRGTEEGDRAATPTVPAAADQGHHRRRRHRYCRLDAGQARAARVRGRCHPIAEVIVDRCNTCQLALCWFFGGQFIVCKDTPVSSLKICAVWYAGFICYLLICMWCNLLILAKNGLGWGNLCECIVWTASHLSW